MKGGGDCQQRPALSLMEPPGEDESLASLEPNGEEEPLAQLRDSRLPPPQLWDPPPASKQELSELEWAIYQDGRFNEQALMAYRRAQPPTPGAVRAPAYTPEQLAELLEEHPGSLLAVSDVHGNLPLLQDTLRRLRVVDQRDQRQGETILLQLGDLADGRNGGDVESLQWGAQRFDVLLAGNHEAALLGGSSFSEMPHRNTRPELYHQLRSMTSPYDLRLSAAYSHQGVLFTHAGVHPSLGTAYQRPEQAAEYINQRWEEFLARNSEQDPGLFTVGKARGGISQHGGVLWQGWQDLNQVPQSYRQVVGHTPLAWPEVDPQVRTLAIDQAGHRLGLAVLLPDGRLRLGVSEPSY